MVVGTVLTERENEGTLGSDGNILYLRVAIPRLGRLLHDYTHLSSLMRLTLIMDEFHFTQGLQLQS